MRIITLLLLGIMIVAGLNGQNFIELKNPSFEDNPQPSTAPIGWSDCGYEGHSPPDILPSGDYEVDQVAKAGETFMGLVVRDDGSWESLGQRLRTSLIAGERYQFSIYLAKSNYYFSMTRRSNEPVNFDRAIVLRIWGGDQLCNKMELLAESAPVDHSEWEEYIFDLMPEGNYDYLSLEAFYKTPIMFEYNGNLLIDHCSGIGKVDKGGNLLTGNLRGPKLNDTTSLAEIKIAIKDCPSKGDQRDILVHTTVVKNMLEFERKTRVAGIRQYILTNPKSELFVMIRNAEAVFLAKTVELVKETARIYYKNKDGEEMTEEEFSFFESSDEVFTKSLSEDNLEKKLDEYILRHKLAVISELNSCN